MTSSRRCRALLGAESRVEIIRKRKPTRVCRSCKRPKKHAPTCSLPVYRSKKALLGNTGHSQHKQAQLPGTTQPSKPESSQEAIEEVNEVKEEAYEWDNIIDILEEQWKRFFVIFGSMSIYNKQKAQKVQSYFVYPGWNSSLRDIAI